MGFNYLNEGTEFYCGAVQTVRFKCRAGQKNTYADGKLVLTEDAEIDAVSKLNIKTIVCPILSGATPSVPQMCRCKLTSWLNKGKAVINGKDVLLDILTPVNMCGACGIPIFVNNSTAAKNVEQGMGLINISSIKWQEIYKDKSSKNAAINDKKISKENVNSAAKNNSNEIKSTENKQTDEQTIQSQSKVKTEVKSNLMCPYTDCEKCRSCTYPQAGLTVDNESQKLRRAYEQMPQSDKDDYDRYYEQIYDKYETTRWSYAAHHIISGNQVFKPQPELVRLANFYGYDINCAPNCIMLVSKEDDYSSKVKSVSAYDAMSESGMQWHLGGHSYTFDAETISTLYKQIEVLTHEKPLHPLKNYAQLLSDELGKMEQSLTSRKVCRNTPQQKAAFIKRMNNLSKKVKAYLAAFKEKPAASYPYYVSKEAYLYTFSLPYTSKVIFIKAAQHNSIYMELFRVGRTRDEIKSKGSNIFSLSDEQSRIDCVKFCSNVEHFLFIDGDTAAKSLPFKPDISKALPIVPLEADGYMRYYASDILVWLRDTSTAYTAPLRKINERLREAVNN